jgi:hypothetical protein
MAARFARADQLNIEQLMARERHLQDQPARRPIPDRHLRLLIIQGLLLAALIVGGALAGLARSVRGWEAIGLGWLAVNLLVRHVKPARPVRALLRGWLTLVVGMALAAALLTAPGFHLPTVKIPKVAAQHTQVKAPAKAAKAASLGKDCPSVSLEWLRCLWEQAGDKAKALSPTPTTRPRKEKT